MEGKARSIEIRGRERWGPSRTRAGATSHVENVEARESDLPLLSPLSDLPRRQHYNINDDNIVDIIYLNYY